MSLLQESWFIMSVSFDLVMVGLCMGHLLSRERGALPDGAGARSPWAPRRVAAMNVVIVGPFWFPRGRRQRRPDPQPRAWGCARGARRVHVITMLPRPAVAGRGRP